LADGSQLSLIFTPAAPEASRPLYASAKSHAKVAPSVEAAQDYVVLVDKLFELMDSYRRASHDHAAQSR
jgi:hypothetical protein